VPVSVVPDLTKLPRDEQETHARAQRFARVRVAEMRLYRAQAVKEGRDNQNLFEALRKESSKAASNSATTSCPRRP